MPKIVNHDERRRDIAAAAARTIAELGIDRVTMSDLAAAAGCTVGALPHYFPSKDDILIAALRHVHEAVRTRASQRALATQLDAVEVWLSILPTSAEQRREWRVWLAFAGRAAHVEALAEEFQRRYAQGHEDTKLMLRALQGGRLLPKTLDLDLAAESLSALIDGLGTRATLEPRAWPASRQRTQLRYHLGLMGYQGRTAG